MLILRQCIIYIATQIDGDWRWVFVGIQSFLIVAILYACYIFTKTLSKQVLRTKKDVESGKDLQKFIKRIEADFMGAKFKIVYENQNEEQLPEGWRVAYTEDNKMYYVNDITQTTQWEKPAVVDDTASDVSKVSISKRIRKLSTLRKNTGPKEIRLEIGGDVDENELTFNKINTFFGGKINKINVRAIRFRSKKVKALAIQYCENRIIQAFQNWFTIIFEQNANNKQKCIDDFMSRIENGDIVFATEDAKEAVINYLESQRPTVVAALQSNAAKRNGCCCFPF